MDTIALSIPLGSWVAKIMPSPYFRACAASDTPVKPVDTEAINVQAIWQQPVPPPSAEAGMHRFVLGPPAATGFGGGGRRASAETAPKDACTGSEPPPPPARQAGGGGGGAGRVAPALQPGSYTIRLTVDGQTYTQPAHVDPDPRGDAPDHANPDAATRS